MNDAAKTFLKITIGVVVLVGAVALIDTSIPTVERVPEKVEPVKLSETAAFRKAYGQELRTHYLDEGLDIKVRVYGKFNTTIKLEYILFNDVWIHHFHKGPLLKDIQKNGFTKIIFNSSRHTWWWDFKPEDSNYILK
jgi:hypothetical protein